MSNKVIFIFKAIDKYTSVGKKIANINARMKRTFASVVTAARKFNAKIMASTKAIKKFGEGVVNVGRSLSIKLTAPLIALGAIALKQSANLESLSVSFEVLIGDAQKAKKVFDELIRFTATTPFQLESVSTAGKQLLAFGVSAEKLVPTLRMLGELAAATGRPLEEFSLIYGKIMAKGRVQGEELLQLAEKGISLQTILGKKFGVSGKVISDAVSKGQISFKIFEEALIDITKEGGKFNGLTEKLSATLGGLTSTLKDSTLLALRELGDVLVKELNLKEFLSNLIIGINKLTKSIGSFAKKHPTITKFLLVFAGFLIVIGPILLIVGQLVIGFALLTVVASFLGTTIAAMTLPFLAIVAVIALLGFAVVFITLRWKKMGEAIQFIWSDIVTSMRTMLTNSLNFIDRFITSITDRISQLKQMVLDFTSNISDKVSGLFDFSGDISTSSSTRTDINVNMIAPRNTIESIKSKTTGKRSGLNIGVNMEHAL